MHIEMDVYLVFVSESSDSSNFDSICGDSIQRQEDCPRYTFPSKSKLTRSSGWDYVCFGYLADSLTNSDGLSMFRLFSSPHNLFLLFTSLALLPITHTPHPILTHHPRCPKANCCRTSYKFPVSCRFTLIKLWVVIGSHVCCKAQSQRTRKAISVS